ncbi:MAG: wax ester/triacylglycerol synthase family O-acyltransferase [Actinobacteria bacterium]|nr:wax ester/triacylglycerol synthase family O-acyltransferase [Actinomycetota bacterium]
MTPERLSSLDASFLYLETPAVHMHVAGVSVFDPRDDGPLTYDDVQRVVEARLHLVPRLRQRVLSVPFGLARPLWIDDDRFDLDFHLRRAAIPSPGGRFHLERAVGRVLSRPLDPSKPLWELYVFEGLAERRTAVLLKLHHALSDGISGMAIASALFDLAPDAPIGTPPAAPWKARPSPTREDLVREAAQDLVLHPIEAVGHAIGAPVRTLHALAETFAGVRDVVDMGAPPAGPFDTEVGPARRFAMAESSFARIREIKRVLGGTVNDVVLTAVAGGLHDLLEHRGDDTRGGTLRVMVPVSIRTKAERGEVGNRVAPAVVDVPVGPLRARTRLQRVRRATAQLKDSSMAVGADTIIGLGAYAPPALHSMAARLASRGRWFNLVVSNVPAPQVPLYLAGAPLVANYPSMPLGERSGLSIACTSLAGTMAFGLTADWDSLPDVEVLARGIESAVDELEKAAAAAPSKRRG